MRLTPWSSAARMVETDSLSSVPPHIHPPMAQVPRATREIWIAVPGIPANSVSGSRGLAGCDMVLLLVHVLEAGCEIQARFLSGDQSEGGPVEVRIPARDPRDQTVPH